jgi:hypothetical protein
MLPLNSIKLITQRKWSSKLPTKILIQIITKNRKKIFITLWMILPFQTMNSRTQNFSAVKSKRIKKNRAVLICSKKMIYYFLEIRLFFKNLILLMVIANYSQGIKINKNQRDQVRNLKKLSKVDTWKKLKLMKLCSWRIAKEKKTVSLN